MSHFQYLIHFFNMFYCEKITTMKVKYCFMRFANLCIMFLSKFYTIQIVFFKWYIFLFLLLQLLHSIVPTAVRMPAAAGHYWWHGWDRRLWSGQQGVSTTPELETVQTQRLGKEPSVIFYIRKEVRVWMTEFVSAMIKIKALSGCILVCAFSPFPFNF